MKKLIALLTIAGFMTFGISNLVVAQEQQTDSAAVEQTVASDSAAAVQEAVAAVEEAEPAAIETETEAPVTFRESIKKQFIDGGPGFMGIVLIILLLGMAVSIERIIYLTMSSANSEKLLKGIEEAMKKGDVEAAKKLCVGTRGPVASIFTQGLIRLQDGQTLEEVEKSLVSYGAVAASKLESGVSWIGLCIGLAPMFGFMGTVIGMIQAFDDIAAAGDMSPTVVASGMKVALLTTVFGLIAAIILQVFFNLIATKIESITNDMENSSISFMDILVKYTAK
jgi:Biopolymer transport proteins